MPTNSKKKRDDIDGNRIKQKQKTESKIWLDLNRLGGKPYWRRNNFEERTTGHSGSAEMMGLTWMNLPSWAEVIVSERGLFYRTTCSFAKAILRVARRDAAKRRHEQKADGRNIALRERADAIKEKEKVCTSNNSVERVLITLVGHYGHVPAISEAKVWIKDLWYIVMPRYICQYTRST